MSLRRLSWICLWLCAVPGVACSTSGGDPSGSGGSAATSSSVASSSSAQASASSGSSSGAGGSGGSGPAIQLSGVDWTPNRDATGDVLTTDFGQLPVNRWVRVAGALNKLSDVAAAPPYPSGYGPDGFKNIVGAWGGAAWDAKNDRLNVSGGGHGDASAAETEILAVDAHRMQVEVAVPRQPAGSALRWNGAALEAGEGWPGGQNFPLSTGVPGSMHTYYGLRWIPPDVMATLGLGASIRGGMFYPGNACAVVNLDTGAYTTPHWVHDTYDISYVTAVRYKSEILLPYGYFYVRRWDMAGSEMTDWQGPLAGGFNGSPATPSFGKRLPSVTAGKEIVNGSKTFVDLPEVASMITFAGTHQRIRYGDAVDAKASDWTAFQDDLTISGAPELDDPNNYVDNGTNLLNSGGAAYLHATGDVFICPNTQGSEVYRVSGLAKGSAGTATKLAGSGLLTTSGNGTFGRFAVFQRGGAILALRISSVDAPIEVMHVE